MENILLLVDTEKYSGQYVATRSFQDKEVVCAGPEPVKVTEEAKGMGIEEPVVFYVPEKDLVQIY